MRIMLNSPFLLQNAFYHPFQCWKKANQSLRRRCPLLTPSWWIGVLAGRQCHLQAQMVILFPILSASSDDNVVFNAIDIIWRPFSSVEFDFWLDFPVITNKLALRQFLMYKFQRLLISRAGIWEIQCLIYLSIIQVCFVFFFIFLVTYIL